MVLQALEYPCLSTASTHEETAAKSNREWLSNASYQPAPSPHTSSSTHEELLPPSKRIKEDKQQREKEQRAHLSKPVPTKPKTNWFDESGLAPQEAFRLDSSSDHANLQYNALYSGDIATYRRRFGGQCLGLRPDQSIEWTDNRGKKLVKKNKEKTSRYFSLHLPQNESCLYLGSRKESTISSRQSHAPFFMALESSATNSGTGVSTEEKIAESELTSEVFTSQQTAAYNRTLQENPKNVRLWLEFMAFQQIAQGPDGAGEEKLGTTKSLRALNERKLAIFERALEHNPTSIDLHISHLELLREMDMEPGTILKKWRDLVFRMPNKPLLWLKYSEFCRMQFSSFTLPSLASLYLKSITTLTAIVEGVMKSHSPEPGTLGHLLALFAQFCHCLAAAGQSERAVACYQALIEYNLCCPPNVATSAEGYKQRIAFFEPFWDSGAPRLGEEGAVGWRQWMETSQSQQTAKTLTFINAQFLTHSAPSSDVQVGDSEQCTDPELGLIAGHPLPEAWLLLENHRQQMDALPYRGPDDELSDPERAVLFEDVSQCMFTVNDPCLQVKLVLQYLQFLGVGGGAPCLDALPHLLSSHLHCAQDALAASASSGGNFSLANTLQSSNYSMLYPHSFCGVSSAYSPVSTTDLLPSPSWTSHTPLPSPSMSCFISNTCNQLLSLLPSSEAQTAVALEWVEFELSLVMPALSDPSRCKSRDTRQRTKAVQKLVKSLLKHESHRNNLCLWDCCAQLELLLIGRQEAQTLYETVLSQYSTLTPSLLPLYQHYCELLMGLNEASAAPASPSTPADTSRALQLTVCVAEGRYSKSVPSLPPSHLLRARHLYEQKPVSDKSCTYHLCHAYFEYLSRGIESACRVFDNFTSTELYSLSTAQEEQRASQIKLRSAYYHQVNLLLCHANSKPIAPSLLWSVLDHALATFPEDPHFLSAYTDSQQPLYLMGRLRRYFDTGGPKAETALPWIHAVRAEVLRYKRVREGDMEGATDVPAGLINRIRALFNRAVQSVNGRGCPLLWRLAMSFEVCPYTHACTFTYSCVHTCTCMDVGMLSAGCTDRVHFSS